MRASVWPYARDRMTAQDRDEVDAWTRAHPKATVVIGRNLNRRRFFAHIARAVPGTLQSGMHPTSPIDAFRDAAAQVETAVPVEIRSVLS